MVSLASQAELPRHRAAQRPPGSALLNRIAAPILAIEISPGGRATRRGAREARKGQEEVRGGRVFAVQYAQQLSFADSYGAYAGAMDRLLAAQVVPYLAQGRPNLVVLNEDIGLLTAFMGRRAAVARGCGSAPGAALRAFGLLGDAYAPQVAYYQRRYPEVSATRALFLALSDVMNRAFLSTFGPLAARYGVYLIAGACMAPATTDATAEEEVLLGDPERPPGAPVYVARGPAVYNAAYLWDPTGAVVGQSRKVNLTAEEGPGGLDLTPATLGPTDVPILDTPLGRLGVAISLDAFVPSYVRYLHDHGAEILVQPEANSGLWAAYSDMTEDPPGWQPQTWMASCWQAVQTYPGFRYGINPFMVGNLFDIPFDGQSAIVVKCPPGRHEGYYAGNGAPVDGEPWSGPRSGFLRLAPWVLPSHFNRAALQEWAIALAPGSGAPEENAYMETCLWADIDLDAADPTPE